MRCFDSHWIHCVCRICHIYIGFLVCRKVVFWSCSFPRFTGRTWWHCIPVYISIVGCLRVSQVCTNLINPLANRLLIPSTFTSLLTSLSFCSARLHSIPVASHHHARQYNIAYILTFSVFIRSHSLDKINTVFKINQFLLLLSFTLQIVIEFVTWHSLLYNGHQLHAYTTFNVESL